jgi:hypothetical protein
MNTDPQVKPSDPVAATYRTDIKGWVSRDGHYYGNDSSAERAARYAGSTVSECKDCGALCPKHYVHCDVCREKATHAKYEALPLLTEYEYPLALFGGDSYFWDASDLETFCDSNEVNPESLMLVTCDPENLRELDAEHWESDLPEDGELPKAIIDALDTFNVVIREHGKAVSWRPAGNRVAVTCADIGLEPLPTPQS